MSSNIFRGSVFRSRFEMKNETTASSNEITNANSAAETTPGAINGSVT